MLFFVKLKIVMAMALIFLLLFPGCQKEQGIGEIAPDLSLRDLSGRTVSLQQHRGNVTLLDFWATWCPPCRMSIPELVRLQEKYGEKGFVVLGISLDDPALHTNKSLLAFKETAKINYTILRYDRKVLKDYFGDKTPAIPTMFLIDRQGKIREKFVGFIPGAIEKSLTEFL